MSRALTYKQLDTLEALKRFGSSRPCNLYRAIQYTDLQMTYSQLYSALKILVKKGYVANKYNGLIYEAIHD